MKTVKSFILLLAIGLGLTACNSSFEDNKSIAPSPLPFGVFSLETNDADYAYKLIHTKSVQTGLDALYLLRETLNPEPDENPYRIVIVGTESDGYDANTGTLITRADYSFYGDGLNNTSLVGGTLSLVSSPYLDKYQYSCTSDNGKLNIYGNAELVSDFDLPLLFGLWHNGSPEDPADERVFVFDTEEIAGLGLLGFMASYDESGSVQYDYFTFSYDAAANSGTITFYEDDNYAATTGLVYTFYFDDLLSLVIVDENGNILTNLDPDPSGSEPEPFSEIATGTVTLYYSGDGSTWYDLFSDPASLYHSDLIDDHYQIDPFLVDGVPLDFTEVSPNNFILPSKFYTGYSNFYVWRWGDYSSAYANDIDGVLEDDLLVFDCLFVVGTSLYYCEIDFEIDSYVNGGGTPQSVVTDALRKARNHVDGKLSSKTYVINPAARPINEQIARRPMSRK